MQTELTVKEICQSLTKLPDFTKSNVIKNIFTGGELSDVSSINLPNKLKGAVKPIDALLKG